MSSSDDIPSSSGKSTCRQYLVCKTSFQGHYTIRSTDARPMLYGDISSFADKPDLLLHAGADKEGLVIAMCKFPKFSSMLRWAWEVGLGGPQNDSATHWGNTI